MARNGGKTGTPPAPSEAFSTLGNETRMEILQALGEADEPLSFSTLRKRLGRPASSQFNYHLNKLVGHFVRQTDDGYELRGPGERVIQAVLSGAVTESPTVDPTELDEQCYHCGSRIWTDYQDGRGFIYCPNCSGNYEIPEDILVERLGEDQAAEFGVKSTHVFPPALVKGRSASEMRRVEAARFQLDIASWGIDLCPRCCASLEPSVAVCDIHDTSEGLCAECGNLQATMFETSCTNCTYSKSGLFSYRLLSHTAMLDFITDHGLNPVAPEAPEEFWGYFTPYEEDIASVEPFEARFTFTIDQDAITLTVDDDLSVVSVTRYEGTASES